MTAGALAEDFENQQRSVIDGQLKMALQIALLSRAQRLVKQHFGSAHLLSQRFYFIGLPAANEKRSIRRTAFASHPLNRL